jgi:hypothetical protein
VSWTYDGNPGTATAAERRDAVRLAIGDTLSTDQQVTDGEIAYYLDNTANSVPAAAIDAVRGLIAKYSRAIDTQVEGGAGGVGKVWASQRAATYQALLLTLQSNRANVATVSATGQSKSTNRGYDANTDAVQPVARLRQDNYTNGSTYDPLVNP